MSLELMINEVEKQLERKYQTKEYVYVEPELIPAIRNIFDNSDSATTEDLVRLKELFRKVGALDKSTGLGCLFYNKLEQSLLPFAEEILREAVDTEPYYNCNDAALKSYVAVALRNANNSDKITGDLLQHLPDGHHFHYINILRTIGDSRPSTSIEIPDELKNKLISVVSESRFPQTRNKALCVLVYFNIKDIIPTLKNRMQEFAPKIEGSGFDLLAETGAVAMALEYLT